MTRHIRNNAVGYLALFIALGGTSYAVSSHSGLVGSGTIYACAKKGNGVLRIVRRGARCRHGEVALSWNQQGLAGSVGPRGARGAQGVHGPTGQTGQTGQTGLTGLTGERGPAGATNVVVRTETGGAVASGSWYVFSVRCQAGERAVGGGARYNEFGGKQELEESYPVVFVGEGAAPAKEGETPNGWASIIRNDDGSPEVPTGYAVCAKP
jgi:hypothetical protein